ncbi:hypothetical protein CL176_03375 [Suicoccus acidiformans]|uniref:Cell division protein DivIVA n=1 Tax=Suicoccus acidiformans TaxID=2036206 RepID=A0A347WJ89_9LACT|nr:DivIVA domain-containing protein [Suicoccus acidiformans]AXY25146.1 hypothetical protein CL176_03375 [Suicoccus acidiformans]
MSSGNHFSLGLFGYNRKQVDDLLGKHREEMRQLEDRIQKLEASNQELAEQVEYYVDIESALKEGIVDAHMTGNKIIEKSNQKADALIAQTNEQVIQYKEDFAHQSRELVTNGQHLHQQLNTMKGEMQEIIDQYQKLLDDTDFDKIYPKKQIDRLVQQVDTYEHDGWFEEAVEEEVGLRASSLSEDEKTELERLIHEVIGIEEVADVKEEGLKLVDFQKAKELN